jgi:hypothetical protein
MNLLHRPRHAGGDGSASDARLFDGEAFGVEGHFQVEGSGVDHEGIVAGDSGTGGDLGDRFLTSTYRLDCNVNPYFTRIEFGDWVSGA